MEKFNSVDLLYRSFRSMAVEGESTVLGPAHAPNRSIRLNRPNSFKWKLGFRQVLPVVPRAGREQTVRKCIINSHLWHHFHQFQLVTNMRAARDDTYREVSEWLLRSGTGDEAHDANDHVTLPDKIMTESLQEMINFVYPPTQPGDADLMQDPTYMSERCCLTPLNENSHEINDLILR